MRESSGSALEAALAKPLAELGFVPTAADADFINGKSETLLEVKAQIASVRDFHSIVTHLALALDKVRPKKAKAILLVWQARMTLSKMKTEWHALLGIMSTEVADKLQLVAVTADDEVAEPHDRLASDLIKLVRQVGVQKALRPRRHDRSFETLKVLLLGWLRQERPFTIGRLQEITGLSHPTVTRSLRDLGDAIERTSNRSVHLRTFPTDQWAELVARAPRLRSTQAYTDRSGRPGQLEHLVERIRRKPPRGVAFGGVLAAHHWDPDFDLRGTPRIDLCVHSPPSGWMDLDFVSRLDPALQWTRRSAGVVLVVHALTRDEPLYSTADGSVWADPVETLLDLHELKLRSQADELVRHLRSHR